MEIIGQNLESVFEHYQLEGICTYYGFDFCIYELSKNDYRVLQDIPDDKFDFLFPDAWFRYATEPEGCSVMNVEEVIVNNEPMYVASNKSERTEFDSLFDYLLIGAGVGMSVNNVAAMSVLLARLNNTTQAKLWKKYEV